MGDAMTFLNRWEDFQQFRKFAETCWCAEDVMAAAEKNGVVLTEAQAEKWLEKNERWFRDALTEYGNEVLASVSRESFEEARKC